MASIASWIYDKSLRGNYTFTHNEVVQEFHDMSTDSIVRALEKIKVELMERLNTEVRILILKTWNLKQIIS